jgi:hypothetical protein
VKILDTNVGYVECDICGTGYNHFSAWLHDDGSYEFRRKSKCYGERHEVHLNLDGFLGILDEESRTFVATRYGRNTIKELKRNIRSGEINRSEVDAPMTYDSLPVAELEAPYSTPRDNMVVIDEMPTASWVATFDAARQAVLNVNETMQVYTQAVGNFTMTVPNVQTWEWRAE